MKKVISISILCMIFITGLFLSGVSAIDSNVKGLEVTKATQVAQIFPGKRMPDGTILRTFKIDPDIYKKFEPPTLNTSADFVNQYQKLKDACTGLDPYYQQDSHVGNEYANTNSICRDKTYDINQCLNNETISQCKVRLYKECLKPAHDQFMDVLYKFKAAIDGLIYNATVLKGFQDERIKNFLIGW